MASLCVLLIEDDEDDATLVLRELRHAGYELVVVGRVATAADLRAALARQAWDLVTCDYNLPGFSALAALALIREHDGTVPVVVVSGEIGEELTVSLIRAGADDLVLKHNLGRLPGAVEHALRDAENRRRRAAAEAALQEEAKISAALARVGQECVASLETTALLHRVCHATTEVLGCDYSHTALWDPEEQAFVVAAGDDTPEHWERVRMLKFPLALIAEHAAQLRRDGIVHMGPAELASDSTASAMAAATGVAASLLVPLWRGEELIGIHTAGYRRPAEDFAPWQRRIAAGIGHLTSLALDNAHLLDRLTRADRIKSEFLSAVSHELRTPLNHIIGFNDILLEEADQLTAEQSDMLQTIGRSSRDLLALINGILDVQRLEAAPATAPAVTDVAELLRQLTATTARLTDRKDLHVICELPPELPAVRTDLPRLKAVLQNLIDNAVKFTPHGSVTISAEPRDDGVLFTVADTGVGIPHEVLPIIFEPFRQGDGSLTRRHGGVGLGLYIVRREVDRLGGEVTVESEVGRGSTFRVWIPCAQRPSAKSAADPQKGAPTLYAEILDAISDLVRTATPDGRLLYANRAWRAALGYESDELRALSLDDIIHPKSRAEFYQARQRALGGDAVNGLHVKCIAKDGRTVELEGSIRCRFTNGEPAFTLGIYQNVTERTEAERQAEARRQLLEAILENLPVGVWITDATGRITQANPAALRIWGGARYVGIEEYGRYKGRFLPSGRPVAAEEWAAARAIANGETTTDEEVEIESFDGTRKIILNSAIPLRDEAQDIVGAIIINHDITGLKQVEQALRESEQRFRALVEHAADGIYVHDTSGIIVEVNPQACASVGYARDELIGRPLTDIDPQLDPDRARQDLLLLESGAPVLVDTIHRRKDGSTFPVEVRSVRCLWNGQPHVFGICRDVTERKRTEQTLRENEARYRDIFENAHDAIYTHDLLGNYTSANPEMERLTGYTQAQLLTMNAVQLIVPGHFQLSEQSTPGDYVMDALTKDGRRITVEVRAQPISRNGKIVGWEGIARDITERKRMELALREAQVSLQLATESAKVAVWTSDLRTLTIRFSSGWKRVLGRDEGEITLAALWDLVHPDDRAKATLAIQEHLHGRASAYETEQRMLHVDGSYRWVLSRGVVAYDTEGRPSHLFGADIDVTERKALEDALRALSASLEQQVAERTRELAAVNERLRLITDNMSDMVSQVSLEGVFQYVSPAHERVLGYAPQQMLGKSVLDFLHPDDVARVTATIEATLDNASSGRAEFRYRHADGHYIWLETVGKLLFDDHGAPFAAVLNGRDVTERRRAEETLRESEECFSSAFEFAAIGKALVAPDGRWLKVNRALCDLVGYREEELLQKTFQDITHPSDLETDLAYVRQMLAGEIMTYQMEKRYFHKSGDVLWVLLSVSLVRDSEGQPMYFISQIQDIGARKRAEADIRRLNAELEQRVLERTAQLEAANKELEAFSYSVSHDLRAPLRHIEGFSKMLVEDCTEKVDDQGRHYLDRIQAGCQRMGQLIDDLLALSRVSRQPLRREPVDLTALARSVTAGLQAANPERVVDLVFADGIIAPGDPSLLRVVLENLLGNAWKYTAKRPHACIELGQLRMADGESRNAEDANPQSTIRNSQSAVAYFVRDDGAGFDPAFSDKLFAPFQRLHNATEFEGTGIGLAIVARIVRRHGGHVWAEGAVEQGATFYFTLGDSSSGATG